MDEKRDIEDQTVLQKRWFSFLMTNTVPAITDEKVVYDDSGFLNKVTFKFVFKLLKIGYKRTIEVSDLFSLPDDMKVDSLYDKFAHNYARRTKEKISAYTLLLALFDTFRFQYLYAILAIGLCDMGNCCLPLLSRKLIQIVQLRSAGYDEKVGDGIGYALGSAFGLYVCFLLGNHYLYYSILTAVQTKAVLTKTLISKAFKADDLSKHKYPISKLTTFVSTDIAKIEMGIQYAPIAMSFPTTLAVVVAVLAIYVGAPAAVGIGVVLLFTLTLSGLAAVMIKVRKRSLVFTDKRINYIKEVVNNLKIIKLYSWEDSYDSNIESTRTSETHQLYKLQFIKNILIAIAISLSSFASMASFLVLFETDSNGKDPATVFSSLSLFSLLGYFIITIPLSVGTSADAVICLGRIAGFLESEEAFIQDNVNFNPSNKEEKAVVQVKDATFFWNAYEDVEIESQKKKKLKAGEVNPTETKVSDSFFLKDMNFEINRGEFVIVTGVIGAGKSSLLNALSGFMSRQSGEIDINGSILLCSTNWIQNETLKNNILFGNEYDPVRYSEIVEACGLVDDFAMLPAGDNTEVGERGITLSGGQRARVNLARAVYHDSDIILLDDVLSAVDARVGKHIMDTCIMGVLKNKTRLLATHQLSFINGADRVIFLNGDGSIDVGTVEELNERNELFKGLISYNYKDQTAVTDTVLDEKDLDVNVQTTEEDQVSEVDFVPEVGKPEDLKRNKSRDYDATGKLIEDEHRAVNTISWDIYKQYVKLGSSPFNPVVFVMFIVFALASSTFFQIFTNVWLSFWTADKFHASEGLYMSLYIIFTCLSFVFLLIQFLCFIHLTNLASRKLTVKSVQNLLNAPMSYLDTTPIGRIMNRFTKDTDSLDNEIVEQFRLFGHSSALIIGVVVMCIIYLPWFAIAVPILIVLFIFVGSYYQASSREIKRLEAVQRSFVYNNYNESLTGMEVIKAFKRSDKFVQRNDRCLDNMNEANYLVNAVQRWLAMQLNGIAFLIVATITLLSVNRVFSINPSSAGLLVSYLMGMPNMLTLIVQSYTQLENEMNAVERMCEFAFRIPQEKAYHITETTPPPDWPSKGGIEFNNVSMCYRPGLPKTLKSLSLKVNPNERIGICGRTGAGKSSLISVIFRLTELLEGSIKIDGIDISSLGLFELRSKLSIIPQESVLFRGTIRTNLDPFDEKTDEELWEVLVVSGCVTKSELDKLRDIDDPTSTHKFHLKSVVEDDGTNFSLGERQLIAFARALVKNSKILMLDEATSSVDYKTDARIQNIIMNNFNHCTILCIAHRLQTILNYDKIVVLDSGEIKEFDTPWNLFKNESSVFRSLCEKAKIDEDDFVNKTTN